MARNYNQTESLSLQEALIKFAELAVEYRDVEMHKFNVECINYTAYVIRYR